jgi:two-component system OmpR family sensor kinase
MTVRKARRQGGGEANRRAARWRGWSLRTRLLAGLIALTTVFLVVMGVVSTIVIGATERNQLNDDLRLTASQSPAKIAAAISGYAAAYLSVRTGAVGQLTPPSPAGAELQGMLTGLDNSLKERTATYRTALARRGTPFNLSAPNDPALRVAWRPVTRNEAAQSGGLLPAGPAIILVGLPTSEVGRHVRSLVLAELITGGALIALLAVCGNWLIGRGLAPLNRMASTAAVITSSGDLTARMPDPGDRRETGRLAEAINTMLDRIQHAFGARLRSEQKVRQFAADASHELRTPLTTIRGYAELYRQGALGPAEMPNAMRRIEQEADRMSRLVAELLELARLDRTSSLSLTETDLSALARDAVADAQAVEPDRPLSAQVPASLVVIADEPRIRQVLANLLGNVRAHTPPRTPVIVRLSRDGQGALLEVADAGPGMSGQDAARAFDRFHRGARGDANGDPDPASQAGEAAGSGLGLSIVHAIAAAHGGYARLRTALGAGTTVQFWIPAKTVAAPPGRPPASPAPASPTATPAWPAEPERSSGVSVKGS